VLFIHGGGWVAPGTQVQTQQLTAIARSGFQVFSINYPLAPADKFPSPLVSVLRALAWLKSRGHQRVALVGESAGANLASMAIAMLHNPTLFEEFGQAANAVAGGDMLRWGYPRIYAFSCW
jgi:acetyl esterase/lipase